MFQKLLDNYPLVWEDIEAIEVNGIKYTTADKEYLLVEYAHRCDKNSDRDFFISLVWTKDTVYRYIYIGYVWIWLMVPRHPS